MVPAFGSEFGSVHQIAFAHNADEVTIAIDDRNAADTEPPPGLNASLCPSGASDGAFACPITVLGLGGVVSADRAS
jgi:hypothetical protein